MTAFLSCFAAHHDLSGAELLVDSFAIGPFCLDWD